MMDDSLKGKTLLVVDDENDLREIIASELEYFGATVFQADSVKKALEILNFHYIDLIISDIRMPGSTGVDLLKKVRSENNAGPAIILITGFADIDSSEAFALGAESLIHKPFDIDSLLKCVLTFTQKFPERFNRTENVEGPFHFYLSGSLKDELGKNLILGRGGMKICYKDQPTPLGALRAIELHFKDQTLKFDGIIRWKKIQGEKVCVGVEFVKLDKDMVSLATPFQEVTPYIPF
jgi:CheY-like chemotaxis protein